MKTKLLPLASLLFFISLSTIDVFAKKKPKKPKKKEDIVIEEKKDILIDDDIIIEIEEDFEEDKPTEKNNLNKYDVERLNEQYNWIKLKSHSYYSSLYGIADKVGNMILPPIFKKDYSSFKNGQAILKLGNSYGVFDLNRKKWTIPLEYLLISHLNGYQGLYTAKKDNLYGLINSENKIVVPFKWNELSSISGLNNYLMVATKESSTHLKGVYSLVEKELIIPCEYTSIKKIDYQNYFFVEKNNQHNIIDINNKPRFKIWYDILKKPYSERDNFYIVKSKDKYGIINDRDQVVVPLEYLKINTNRYNDGSYLAQNKEGKYGFIKIDGTITLDFKYDNLENSKSNNSLLSSQNGRCGIVQVNTGQPVEIISCNYDDITLSQANSLFIVQKEGKFGLLDKYAEPLTEIIYESLELIDTYQGHIYKGKINGKYQLIDQSGRPFTNEDYTYLDVIPDFNRINRYNQDVAFNYIKVKSLPSDNFKVIDKVGRQVVEGTFDDIVTEKNNLLTVVKNKKYGIYSILNKKIMVESEYDQLIYSDNYYYGFKGESIDKIIITNDHVNKEIIKP